MGDVVLQAIVDTYGASPSRSPLRPDLPSYLVKPEDNLLGGISEVLLLARTSCELEAMIGIPRRRP
jgi:hypothetical protein